MPQEDPKDVRGPYYSATDAQLREVKRKRRTKPSSATYCVGETPVGARQYQIPEGVNRFRLVATGTPGRIRVEFLWPEP